MTTPMLRLHYPTAAPGSAGQPQRRKAVTAIAAWMAVASAVALTGCAATTTTQFSPEPQAPVCATSASALVLWRTQWRADQKDVAARTAAAEEGLVGFFRQPGCFRSALVQAAPASPDRSIDAVMAEGLKRHDKVVLVTVRELGPILKIGASIALVEGGTEVVLDVSEQVRGRSAARVFTAHWSQGGAGVVKGVAGLPVDMRAALAAALQPQGR